MQTIKERYTFYPMFGEVPTQGEPVIPGDALPQALVELEQQIDEALENDGPAWKSMLEEQYWNLHGLIREIHANGAAPEDVTLYMERKLPDLIEEQVRGLPRHIRHAVAVHEAAHVFASHKAFDVTYGDTVYIAKVNDEK